MRPHAEAPAYCRVDVAIEARGMRVVAACRPLCEDARRQQFESCSIRKLAELACGSPRCRAQAVLRAVVALLAPPAFELG